jgi:hypothetical protein
MCRSNAAQEAAMRGSPRIIKAGTRRAAPIPSLVFDPARTSLDDRKIVVHHTRDGGYLCLGFGSGARFLRAVDDEPPVSKASKGRGGGASDPFLSNLVAAVALAKDFNPDQPRDERGRWTDADSSGAAATAAATADALYGNPALSSGLRQLASRVLGALPTIPEAVGAAAGPAAAFFGTLFLPTNASLISRGTLPDAPDFSYSFDQGTGVLTLSRQHDDGSNEILFSDRYGADGVFRDEDGNAIGRHLGSSVALDADAISGYEARAKSGDQSGAGTGTQADAATDSSEPKLCPDPDAESIAGRKDPALRYQTQISGLPPGLQFVLIDPATGKDVSFDGCDLETGTMIEAKGPGYLKRMIDSNHWDDWYDGDQDIEEQLARQSRAAAGRQVEWHFAEEQVADYFRRYAKDKFPNITIYYTPAR